MKSSKLSLIALAIGLLGIAYVFMNQQPESTYKTVKRSNQSRLLITGKRVLKYCPQPSSLIHHHLEWTAPGGWRSVDKPLSNKADRFIKTQWQGVNLGEVICQYRSAGASAFPIELHRLIGKVVSEPTDAAWKKTHSGTKTCFSRRPSNCPFYQRQQEARLPYPELYKEIFQLEDSK